VEEEEEEEISFWKKSMEFPIQSHYLADISMKRLHHQSIAYITMEWRGQQHAREAVESTASSATSTIQAMSAAQMKKNMEHLSPDRMKKDMEESHTGLIKAS